MKKPRKNHKSTHRSIRKIASKTAGKKKKASISVISSKPLLTKMVTIASWIDRGYRLFRYCRENGYVPSGEGIWHAIKEAVSALA